MDRALAKQTRQLEHFHLLENSDSIVKFTLSSSVVVLLLWVLAVFSRPFIDVKSTLHLTCLPQCGMQTWGLILASQPKDTSRHIVVAKNHMLWDV